MPLNRAAAALSYSTFAWDQYSVADPITVAGSGAQYLPLDASDGAIVTNPAGWPVAGGLLAVPDGVYACIWYWESADTGELWDNYAEPTGGPIGIVYPTAPMANTGSYFGSVSFTVKLSAGAGNTLGFYIQNTDGSPHNITNKIVITRTDA